MSIAEITDIIGSATNFYPFMLSRSSIVPADRDVNVALMRATLRAVEADPGWDQKNWHYCYAGKALELQGTCAPRYAIGMLATRALHITHLHITPSAYLYLFHAMHTIADLAERIDVFAQRQQLALEIYGGDIGEPQREVIFEPLPDSVPLTEPTAPTPEPAKAPVPAVEPEPALP